VLFPAAAAFTLCFPFPSPSDKKYGVKYATEVEKRGCPWIGHRAVKERLSSWSQRPGSSPALPLFTSFHCLPFHLMLPSTTSTGPLHAEVAMAHHARAVPLVLQFRLRLEQLTSPDSQVESEELCQAPKNQKKWLLLDFEKWYLKWIKELGAEKIRFSWFWEVILYFDPKNLT
jgi:hypothetical protein